MYPLKQAFQQFLTDFHRTQLKPLGFKKKGHTLSRDKGGYWERLNFQGSSYNGPDFESWTFYLNIGVEFKELHSAEFDLLPRPEPSLFPHGEGVLPIDHWTYFGGTHWAIRLNDLLPDAPNGWDFTHKSDVEELGKLIFDLWMEASRLIEGDIGRVHASALRHEEALKRVSEANY